MKPRYSLILKDNETNKDLLDLNVGNYVINTEYSPNGVSVEIKARGLLHASGQSFEKQPKVFELDEVDGNTLEEVTQAHTSASYSEATECNHDWIEYTGLEDTYQICDYCGIKK